MALERTWEFIVQPESPISLADLKISVSTGEELKLATGRPDLYRQVLAYWQHKEVESTLLRSKDLTSALAGNDREQLERMVQQISGINHKVRLCRASLSEGTLYLSLAGTQYMDFIGTNEQAITSPNFRQKLMQAGLEDAADPNHYFANALNVCAILYGYDNPSQKQDIYVPIGFRSDKVMIYPNVPHVFGGGITVKESLKQTDIGKHLQKELGSEIGLERQELGDAQFYGIVRQIPGRVPEVILGIPVYLPQNQLLERWRKNAPAKFEHKNIQIYKESELEGFLLQHGTTMVPSGAAAIELFLQNRKY